MFTIKKREGIIEFVCDVSLYVVEKPKVSTNTINPVTHNTFRHCRVRFCWTTFLKTAVYLFTSRTCKNSHVEVLFYFSYGKIKSKKSPWVKKTKETGPKKKEKAPFCQPKKNNLAESDKGSWSGQTPTTSSAAGEDPERSKTLLARVLPLPLPLASLPIIRRSS